VCRRTMEMADMPPEVTTKFAEEGYGATKSTLWIHRPRERAPLAIRSYPDLKSHRTGDMLMPGDIFSVVEEREGKGPDGTMVLFLKLASGRGWVFDRRPGRGQLCHRCVPGQVAQELLRRRARLRAAEAAAAATPLRTARLAAEKPWGNGPRPWYC